MDINWTIESETNVQYITKTIKITEAYMYASLSFIFDLDLDFIIPTSMEEACCCGQLVNWI